jgi:amino acid permease
MSFYAKQDEKGVGGDYPLPLEGSDLTTKAAVDAEKGIISETNFGASKESTLSFGDDIQEGTASTLSSCTNMLKTIIGAAIVTLPYALTLYGYILGTFLMICSALASLFGLYLFELCASRLGRKSSPFAVALITVPQTAYVLDSLIAIKSLGVGLSYLIIIAELMQMFIKGLPGITEDSKWLSPQIWLGILAIPIVGLSFLPRMDYLRYSSYLGMMCVFYLVGLSIWDAIAHGIPNSDKFVAFASFKLEALSRFSLFIFAFTCHQNLFPIHNESKNNSIRHITMICTISISLAFVLYMVFGMLSYARYADTLTGSVLKAVPNDPPFQVARVLFVFLLAFSYPLQVLPFRNSCIKLIPLKEEVKKRYTLVLFVGVTLFMLIFDFGIAMATPDITNVMSLVGSVTSSVICYILPALFYISLKLHEPKWDKTVYMAFVLGIFGVLVFFICTGASIYNFFK